MFLRKDVILGELCATKVQECDFKGFTGFGAMFTKDYSTDYSSVNSIVWSYSNQVPELNQVARRSNPSHSRLQRDLRAQTQNYGFVTFTPVAPRTLPSLDSWTNAMMRRFLASVSGFSFSVTS